MAGTVFAQKPESATYEIGDIGAGGGMVFYINENTYLECSAVLGNATWWAASILAEDYRGGGYDDWYLPSKEELNYIYENLRVEGIISDDGWYWSSSELNNAFAWVQRFSDGNQYDNDKAYDDNVRAIRSFTP